MAFCVDMVCFEAVRSGRTRSERAHIQDTTMQASVGYLRQCFEITRVYTEYAVRAAFTKCEC